MKKETIEVYICDFCGIKHENEDWMKLHEQVCSKNPINMPCSKCEHQVIGFGCSKSINCDVISGNVKCFYYKKGEPKSLITLVVDGDDK
jgi:hypothetical protein